MIKGVKIIPLKQIHDERGKIMKMMRNDDEYFYKFGEIYFSIIYPGVIKAWHNHKEMTLNYACIYGQIKLVLYDDRKNSPTRYELMELFLSPENYNLVSIPLGVWNGFKGMGNPLSIVANCATLPHSPDEIIRKSPFSDDIPYNWEVKHG